MVNAIDNRRLFELILALSFVLATTVCGLLSDAGKRGIRIVGVVGAMLSVSLFAVPHALFFQGLFGVALLAFACACNACLLLFWCGTLSSVGPSRAVIHVLMSVLFARSVALACALPWDIVPALLAAAMPMISALLYIGPRPLSARNEMKSNTGEAGGAVFSAFRFVSIVFAVALLGFMLGVYKQLYSANDAEDVGVVARSVATLVVHALAMMSLLLFFRTGIFASAYRITLFLLATGCVCALSTALWAVAFSSALLLWSQFMLMGLAWVIAPQITMRLGGLRLRLIGWGFTVFYAGSALGSLVCVPVADRLYAILPGHAPIQLALALCVLVTHFFLIREQDVQALVSAKEHEYQKGREALSEGCRVVAQEYLLSGRELDVLLHWVSGETAPEISAALSVSENTVRTHIRHIYTKTGVNGRDDLMGLIRLA